MKSLVRFAAVLALLTDMSHVQAADDRVADYEVGTSLVCDTQGQVERFAAFFIDDAEAAIRAVNAEEDDPSACAIVNVAYIRGARLGMTRHGDNAFAIVRILVVGVGTETGILPVRPAAYYSLIGVREYAV
jgi:hypothetical protein